MSQCFDITVYKSGQTVPGLPAYIFNKTRHSIS